MPEILSDLNIEICRPVEEHARQILTWRNNPTTLQMFFHQTPKKWDQFWIEYRNEYFVFPKMPPFFAVENENRVAFLRFKPLENPSNLAKTCCDISINVNPEMRGKNVGTRSLILASNFLKKAGVTEVFAEIRKENEASVRAFEKAGYIFLEETIKHIEDTGENCRIYRYCIELSSSNKERT